MKLRPYQTQSLNAFFEGRRAGKRSQILCAPTGAGKTVMALALAEHLVKHGRKIVFLADRVALLRQTVKMFQHLPIGWAYGEETRGRDEPIQIVTPQTARARDLEVAGSGILTIVDECHTIHGIVRKAAVTEGSSLLGLSATPFKPELAEIYHGEIINVTTTRQLQEEGHLSRERVFCAAPIDRASIKVKSSGEYDADSASQATMRIVGDIVAEWTKRAEGRKTIAFANTVEDANALSAEFRKAGHAFETVSYRDTPDERSERIEAHRSGELLGLVSVEALQRGYDVPDIGCVIDAHPWRKSLASVIQQIGRGLRPAPDKEDCIILDHAENYLRMRDDIEEFWHEGAPTIPERKSYTYEEPDRKKQVCPECASILRGRKCRECGYERPQKPRIMGGVSVGGPEHVNGELHEITDKQITFVGRRRYELPSPRIGWRQICYIANQRGKQQNWAQAQFRNLYGRFFKGRIEKTTPLEPHMELLSAINHSTQLYIDRMKRETKRNYIDRVKRDMRSAI